MNIVKQLKLTAILCFACQANAADYNPSWYIQPTLNATETDSAFGAGDRGYGGGLRFGKPISDMWDMQLGGSYMRAKENNATFRQNLLGVDLMYMFSRSNLRPFLSLGIGAERDSMSRVAGNSTSPYASLGLGLQWGLSDQWSLQADLRRVRGYLGSNDFGFSRTNQNYLTLGLSYAFDASPSAPIVRQPEVRRPDPEPIVRIETPPPPPPVPKRYETVVLSAKELFAFDSAVLAPEQRKLDELASALSANTQIDNIIITGHADRIGSASYNQKLSEQRANAVKEYLINHGIAASRLVASGKGESMPVVTCDNKKRADLIVCLEPNRRVEIEQVSFQRQVP